jgi:hypothetical protein
MKLRHCQSFFQHIINKNFAILELTYFKRSQLFCLSLIKNKVVKDQGNVACIVIGKCIRLSEYLVYEMAMEAFNDAFSCIKN